MKKELINEELWFYDNESLISKLLMHMSNDMNNIFMKCFTYKKFLIIVMTNECYDIPKIFGSNIGFQNRYESIPDTPGTRVYRKNSKIMHSKKLVQRTSIP